MGTPAPRRMLGLSWKIALGLLCAFFVLPAGIGPALDGGTSRSCATADLLGLWEMVRLIPRGSEKVDAHEAWSLPYQQFLFRDNGTLQHTSSVQPISDATRTDATEAVDIMAWTVYADGWLELQRAGVLYPESCACQYLLRNDKDATGRPTHRGQVMLTYMKHGKPAVQKLLRKIQ
jgi:hypothetical protein